MLNLHAMKLLLKIVCYPIFPRTEGTESEENRNYQEKN